MANISIEKNIIIPVRDGIHLVMDLYRSVRDLPKPVLVVHTPNDRDQIVAGGDFDLF